MLGLGLPADSSAPYENMSASLLSRQPPTAPLKRLDPSQDWETTFAHLESTINSLRNWRYSWWVHWSALARFLLPRRYHWVVTPNKMTRGSPINDEIIDTTGQQAAETCGNGMWSGITNPSRDWVGLSFGSDDEDLDSDGKAWVEDVHEKLYDVLSGSNFYSKMAQLFQDLSVFGTAPYVVYEDFETVIRLYAPCAGEYFLTSSARMTIDTQYREFNLTVKQIVEQFTLANCPDEVRSLWEQGGGSLNTELLVGYACEPNFDLARRGTMSGKVQVVPGKFTYRELYWLRGKPTQRPLSKRGFNERPCFAFRWSEVSNDPYGRGPGMNVLGDVKQVQMETLEKGEFIKKLTKPPMGADVSMKNEPASIWPGHITYTNSQGAKGGFYPLFEMQAQALAPLVQDIDTVNKRVEKGFFVDVFMAITQMEGVQPRNEQELTKRDLERLQKLGPVIELVVGELRDTMLRILSIMARRRLIKPLPQSLQGKRFQIKFDTIMRIAQRSAQSVGMKDVLGTMGSLSSAAKAAGVPDPLRVIDLDKSARKYAEINGYPADCVFSPQDVQKHDEAREKAQQQAQQPAQAMAAVDAARTLSQTAVPGGNTALGAMLGGQGGA